MTREEFIYLGACIFISKQSASWPPLDGTIEKATKEAERVWREVHRPNRRKAKGPSPMTLMCTCANKATPDEFCPWNDRWHRAMLKIQNEWVLKNKPLTKSGNRV